MKNRLNFQNEIVEKYYEILSDEFPEFLYDYIETPEMQRIGKIGTHCGTQYTNIFKYKFCYSNLEHSIGVALIVWHFTKDKKQTLAGLFHDIATPVFKHCVDFLNGDSEKQESTEELTTYIIKNSKEIVALLERDGIKISEVDDYHIYPIADNDTPKLSADRLEYTFMNGIYSKDVWTLAEIKEIYDNIEIQLNEDGIQELGFKEKEIAEKFVRGASSLWPIWVSNKDKVAMQFIADILKKMGRYITIDDLYKLTEAEVINKIENCEDISVSECFKKFRNAEEVFETDTFIEDKYCVNVKVKKRYIVPLVNHNNEYKRINEVSLKAQKYIDGFLSYNQKKYGYLDFKM